MAESDFLPSLIGIYDNFHEPTPGWNRPGVANGLVITFLVITWTCVLFRMYTRFRIIYSPGWDDLFVSLLLITGTVGSGGIITMTSHGWGQHILIMAQSDYATYVRLFWISNATYCMSTTFIKLSLLLQYFRVFDVRQMEGRICIGLLIFTAVWGAVFTVLAWIPCVPIEAFIDTSREGVCFVFGSRYASSFYASHLSLAVSNMILDAIIIYLPVISYFRGKTFDTTRLGFLVLFFLGSFVVSISIWRVASIVEHRAGTYPTFDPAWYGPITLLLAVIEVDVASICASIPVFWPVLASKIEMITVTREVKIERTHRFSTIGDATTGDSVELVPTSRRTSHNSLEIRTSRATDGGRAKHYKDNFVLSQVNPLSDEVRVETEISVEKGIHK
ncbi:hypothetical protein S40293_01135 [Stachybotrys chartarum IBT 40293]|nr:hypothetical protein S40293_01135 [Stachybotrys chartarum IBT 40293]